MFIDKAIKAYQDGSFEVDGVLMVLIQRKTGGHDFKGTGHVRCGIDGSLVFKLIDPTWNGRLMFDNPRVEGFYTDDMYYDLEMKELGGAVWKSERILFRSDRSYESPGIILSGNLPWIETTEDAGGDGYYRRLHFFKEHNIPTHKFSELGEDGFVRDKAEFKACGYEWVALTREGSGETVIEALGDKAFPDKFDKRVEEAFQFLTAKTALVRAVYRRGPDGTGVKLIAPIFKVAESHFHPPIAEAHWLKHSLEAWRLFGDYLAYVLKTKKYYWNPVAFHLWNARETAFGSIDARAVGVAVAVEAVCSLVGNRDSNISSEKAGKLKNDAITWLQKQGEPPEVVNRIGAMFQRLAEKSTKDMLEELASHRHIQKSYATAWGMLRNKYVHPKIDELQPPTESKQNKTIQNTYKCEVLLYQLIMHVVGYKGHYTDYGTSGWDDKLYPDEAMPPNESPPVF